MRINFADQQDINHVLSGFEALYEKMLTTGQLDANVIKDFLEPYFKEAGYRGKFFRREGGRVGSKKKFSQHDTQPQATTPSPPEPPNSNSAFRIPHSALLIVHDAGVGDFILMSAAIRELRQQYRGAHITLAVHKSALPMAELCPYVDEVMTHEAPTSSLQKIMSYFEGAMGVARYLLRRRYDLAISFAQYPSTQLLTYMSGAREIVESEWKVDEKAALRAGLLPMSFFSVFATSKCDFAEVKSSHLVDSNLYLACSVKRSFRAWGGESDNDTLRTHFKPLSGRPPLPLRQAAPPHSALELWLSGRDRFIAASLMQPLFGQKVYALSMGSNPSLKCKRYPAQKWAEFVKLLLTREEVNIVILGGAEEATEGAVVTEVVNSERVVNLTKRLSFRQSAAVLELCDLYLGNDTGLMHAAAAAKVAVLEANCYPADKEMSGASSPMRYYPYGVPSVIVQPARALDGCKDKADMQGCCVRERPHCISQIEPETMYKAYRRLLKQIDKQAKEPLFFS